MVGRLVSWAVHNRLVVGLLALALVGVGVYAFLNVNVEAYPDPAPAIVEVIAQFPGASAEEVERQVTIPLEVALAGMPGLQYTRSKSLFGLSHLRNQFYYGVDYQQARLHVLNRLSNVDLPDKVVPVISPASPTGEIYRYFLASPKDAQGDNIYSMTDLKALEDFTLEREFKRVPRIAEVVSFGGAEKRYEVQPDPDRMRRYDVSLSDIERAIRASNSNAGADYMLLKHQVLAVRGLGLLGHGVDPTLQLASVTNPILARDILRKESERRLLEIRRIVLKAMNNVPVRVDDIVAGGPIRHADSLGESGVVVSHHTRLGRVNASRPLKEPDGKDRLGPNGERQFQEFDDVVAGIVLLRKGEQSLPALQAVRAKVDELNSSQGRLLPGVKLERFDDRTNLIARTTHTVEENLVLGLLLVSAILILFLGHAPSAFIVAINIPLALLFAFACLYFRGKSANLLSLGAVDFGIIVDSSVIMVESIYRTITSGEGEELSLPDRILRGARQVEASLFFSTIIMVVALLPLFTMQGPEGQIFGPMADTYAFALGGALVLSLTLSPMLCRLFYRNLKPSRENLLVRGVKGIYLWQLGFVLRQRWLMLVIFAGMVCATAALLPRIGMEFMPQLEEGNVYIRGTFPIKTSLDEVNLHTKEAVRLLRAFAETEGVLSQMGRPDEGTDPTGFYNSEIFVTLKAREEWPKSEKETNLLRKLFFGGERPRTKDELVHAMEKKLERAVIGVDWNFSQAIRDNVMETLSGVKGENSVKIFGPDLNQLEKIAEEVKRKLTAVRGIESVGIFGIMGQSNLEFPIDRDKCALWNVKVEDVQDTLQTAVGGKAFTEMVEGERKFDIALRFPEQLRQNVDRILDIPVEVNVAVEEPAVAPGRSPSMPAYAGSRASAPLKASGVPRRTLRDLVTPLADDGTLDPRGDFVRPGASTIAREQGKRLIAVKFSVRGRDLASAVREAKEAVEPILAPPYHSEWSGEFQQMQEAMERLTIVASLAIVLILVILYIALQSLLDTIAIFSNVVVMVIGGIWALWLCGETFNISAGVGFISILGVGIMNGLLLVSRINSNRAAGLAKVPAITDGVSKLIRPLTMTALAASLGLLPAALSTQIGSQSQRPLAIAVVGGMLMTLVMINLIPVLYSFYGDREHPTGGMAIGH